MEVSVQLLALATLLLRKRSWHSLDMSLGGARASLNTLTYTKIYALGINLCHSVLQVVTSCHSDWPVPDHTDSYILLNCNTVAHTTLTLTHSHTFSLSQTLSHILACTHSHSHTHTSKLWNTRAFLNARTHTELYIWCAMGCETILVFHHMEKVEKH